MRFTSNSEMLKKMVNICSRTLSNYYLDSFFLTNFEITRSQIWTRKKTWKYHVNRYWQTSTNATVANLYILYLRSYKFTYWSLAILILLIRKIKFEIFTISRITFSASASFYPHELQFYGFYHSFAVFNYYLKAWNNH